MAKPAIPKHQVVTCGIKDVEANLDAMAGEYDLVGMCSCQVGSGFGARVEVVLAFRLRILEVPAPAPAKPNGSLPAGRQRRSPMQAIQTTQ